MPSREPGAELGHYRIVRSLGRGGMSQVYLARDRKLQRDVAIKVLTDPAGGRSDSRERLLREAQAVAALDHHRPRTAGASRSREMGPRRRRGAAIVYA